MQVGDVITKIDAIPTPDRAAYQEILWSYNVGDSVSIEYIRDNEVRTTVVELSPASGPFPACDQETCPEPRIVA